MWAGAYGDDIAWVWVPSYDGFETAFEEFVEYLDDVGHCGHFHSIDIDDLQEAARELDIEWEDDWPNPSDMDRNWERVVEHAEADLTIIGHTQLKCGEYIASHEWGGDEIERYTAEWQAIARRSLKEEHGHEWLVGDRAHYFDPEATAEGEVDLTGDYEVTKVWYGDVTLEDDENVIEVEGRELSRSWT
jgi:hypothetical protein